jgi:hypothetical protein
MGFAKKLAPGFVAGVAQSMVPNDAMGGWLDPIIPVGVGYFFKNDTLSTIGSYQLGIQAARTFGAPKGSLGFGQVS